MIFTTFVGIKARKLAATILAKLSIIMLGADSFNAPVTFV